jgi:hypothetical protein
MSPALLVLCVAVLMAAAAPAIAQPGAATASASAAGASRTISWDDLVPPDWDPMKGFKGMDFGALQDSDPRAQDLLKKLREVWDSAPTNPKLEGQAVRLPGFVVPLEEGKDGLREFLLVPYFGACIHSPPPPANQIIHVLPRSAAQGLRSMDTVWVSGTLRSVRTDSFMGTASYRLEAAGVAPYRAEKAR